MLQTLQVIWEQRAPSCWGQVFFEHQEKAAVSYGRLCRADNWAVTPCVSMWAVPAAFPGSDKIEADAPSKSQSTVFSLRRSFQLIVWLHNQCFKEMGMSSIRQSYRRAIPTRCFFSSHCHPLSSHSGLKNMSMWINLTRTVAEGQYSPFCLEQRFIHNRNQSMLIKPRREQTEHHKATPYSWSHFITMLLLEEHETPWLTSTDWTNTFYQPGSSRIVPWKKHVELCRGF